MGASIDLYRLSDATFHLKGLYAMTNKQVLNLSREEFEKYWDSRETDFWDDGNEHCIIDISYYRSCFRKYYRGWKRQDEKLNKLPTRIGFADGTKNVKKYIVADRIAGYAGSALNNRYFDKRPWFTVCISKKDVIKFFKKYGNKYCKPTVDDILNRWDDGKSFLIIDY